MSTWPTHEQLVEFLDGPMDQPVVMLNMLTFKKMADESHAGQTGRDAVMQYSRAMKEFVESHGGTFVIAADIDSQMIGEGGEHFQFIAIMRYPSRQAYIDLAGDPEIANTIGKHRDAGLESQWLFAMTEITE
ncbi:MAG: DUF1330 domain-containing protein [Actinobacteria bacterium]|nr:DUF1330 domain-containing protein [Actinomycetota bacterium]